MTDTALCNDISKSVCCLVMQAHPAMINHHTSNSKPTLTKFMGLTCTSKLPSFVTIFGSIPICVSSPDVLWVSPLSVVVECIVVYIREFTL